MEIARAHVGLRAGQRQKTRLGVVVVVELDPSLKLYLAKEHHPLGKRLVTLQMRKA